MIKVVFFKKDDQLCGYEISGHSTVDPDDDDGRLICSAVSSAAILAANTVTEIIGDPALVKCDEGFMTLSCKNPQRCRDILLGIRLHLSALAAEYPERIEIGEIAHDLREDKE